MKKTFRKGCVLAFVAIYVLTSVFAGTSLMAAADSATNLLANGSFETGDLTGWTAQDSVAIAGSLVGWAIDGDYLTAVGSTQANGVGSGSISQEFTVTPNTVYDIGATYRQNNGNANGVTSNFTMTVTGADTTVLFTDSKTVVRADANVAVNGTFNAGANTTVTLTITCNSTAAGTRPGSFQGLVDNISVTKSAVQPPVIGEFQNGSFETGDLTGWTAQDSVAIAGSLVGWAIDGDYLTAIGSTQANGVGSGSISQQFTVTPNTVYDIGATYRQNNGNANGVTSNFTMTVTGADTTVLFTDSKTVVRADANVAVNGTFNAGANTTVTLTITCNSTSTGTRPGSFQSLVDNISVTKSAVQPPVIGEFQNGSFETGDLTGWTAQDSMAIAGSVIGWEIDGSYVALLGMTKNGNSVSGSISQEFTVTPGKVYDIGATYRQNNGNQNGVTANYTLTVTGGGSTLFTDSKSVARSNGNVVAEGTFNAGTNTTVTVTIACTATATATPGSFQNVVDAISVAESAAQPPVIGEFQNGSFETGDLTGWTAQDSVAVAGSVIGWEIDGSYVAVVGSTQANGVGSGSISQQFTVTPGKFYTIGATYRQNNGGHNGVTANYTMTVTGGDNAVLFTNSKSVVRSDGNVAVNGTFAAGDNTSVTLTIACNSTSTSTHPGSFQSIVDGISVTETDKDYGSNLLVGKEPSNVKMEKSATYEYTVFENTLFGVKDGGTLAPINDGNLTNRTYFWLAGTDQDTHVMGLLYDLRAYCELTKVSLAFPANDVSKGYAQQISVYAGNEADNTLLTNMVARVENTNNSETMTADITAAENYRYVLVVFDKVPTQAPVAWANGAVYLSELEVYGNVKETIDIPDGPDNTPVGDNLLSGKMGQVVYFEHELDWTLETPLTLDKTAMSDGIELGDYLGNGWTDGLFNRNGADSTQPYWLDNTGGMATRRVAVMYDLGDYYDLNNVKLYLSNKDYIETRYILSASVYGGALPNATMLDNFLGNGGGKTNTVSIDLASELSVRYLLIVFEKLGTDCWCDYIHSAHDEDCSPAEGAEAYCAYSNGGVYMTEIEAYGTKGENKTTEVEHTDEETGMSVSVVTYNNSVEIKSIKITKKALTPAQQAIVDEYYMIAPYGLYHIDFLDANGEPVEDMTGRFVTISLPYENGDDCMTYYTEEDGIVMLEPDVDTVNERFIYECIDGRVYSDIVMLTVDMGDSDNEDTGITDGEDDTDSPNTGETIPVFAVLLFVASAAAVMTMTCKKRCR